VLDYVEVVWDVESDRIDGLIERPAELVSHQRFEQNLTLLERPGEVGWPAKVVEPLWPSGSFGSSNRPLWCGRGWKR
jgi:hypothetical protein